MKVLITGATGLIGKEIAACCHKGDIPVNYLTTSRGKIISKKNHQGFYWNPTSGELDLDCFKGVSTIINLAGASISKRWSVEYKKVILSSRINSLRTLHKGLKSVDITNIDSFVSASAIGIYPNSLTKLHEENETTIDNSFLGDVVRTWEQEIDSFNEFGFSVAKVRIGLVLSKNGGALPEIAKPVKLYAGAAFGSGKQWQSWVHINDLARIFLFLAKERHSGIFNGVAPNPVTNTKLVKEIASVLEKPLFLPNIPEFAMKTLLGEMSYLLFASQRASSKKIEAEGFIFEYANIGAALEQIYATSEVEKPTDAVYN